MKLILKNLLFQILLLYKSYALTNIVDTLQNFEYPKSKKPIMY